MVERANKDLSMMTDSKFDIRMSKKYEVNTKHFSPMNATQLTGMPSWRNPSNKEVFVVDQSPKPDDMQILEPLLEI